jgi:hypothetical protein
LLAETTTVAGNRQFYVTIFDTCGFGVYTVTPLTADVTFEIGSADYSFVQQDTFVSSNTTTDCGDWVYSYDVIQEYHTNFLSFDTSTLTYTISTDEPYNCVSNSYYRLLGIEEEKDRESNEFGLVQENYFDKNYDDKWRILAANSYTYTIRTYAYQGVNDIAEISSDMSITLTDQCGDLSYTTSDIDDVIY